MDRIRERDYRREFVLKQMRKRLPREEYLRQKELLGPRLVEEWDRLHGVEYQPKGFATRPPDEIVQEARYAYGCEGTIGQLVMGDPPRGRSALERRA